MKEKAMAKFDVIGYYRAGYMLRRFFEVCAAWAGYKIRGEL